MGRKLDKVIFPNTDYIEINPSTKSLCGNIVSFPDGASAPMPKLEVGIEPVQDLHGYDNPWVGGAGKNKCPINESTITGATYIVDTDINIASGTWTFSFESAVTTNCSLQITDADGNTLASVGISNPSRSATVTINAVGKHLKFYGYAGTYKKIQIESGSIATTYQPYSNICPIIGWDEVNVSVSGVNVWDEEWEAGRINTITGEDSYGNGIRSKNFISIKPSTEYRALRGNYSDASSIIIYYYDALSNYISYEAKYGSSVVFTTPSNATYIRFNIQTSEAVTYNNDISINYPSTDTSYHAYNGQTYTIDLDGTRYGGYVRIVNGVTEFVADRVKMTIDGVNEKITNAWGATSNGYAVYKVMPVDRPLISDGTICDKFSFSSRPYNTMPLNTYVGGSGNNTVWTFILPSTVTTVAEADQWFSDNPTTVVYELATPLTIQLTPTLVKSLQGINNVSADCGNILDLSYFGKEE